MSKTKLLNCAALAAALDRVPSFVTAMRRAGYQLKHPAAGLTTLEHALAALDRAPEFVASHYLERDWHRLPKCLAATQCQAV